MKTVRKILLIIALGSSIAMFGCTAQKSQPSTSETNTKTTEVQKQSNSVDEGSKNMRDALKEINTQLDNKEEDKAIVTSEKLEKNWSSFEDVVKDKSPDLYEKVEVSLGTIQAGVKVKPLDTKTIKTAIENLDKVLTDIHMMRNK